MSEYYLKHYFNLKNAGIFLLVSFVGLFAVLALVLCVAKMQRNRRIRLAERKLSEKELKKQSQKQYRVVESFYEMIFSSTSVLLFLSLYYLIDAYMVQASEFWHRYQDAILLLFIVLSVFLTSWFDVALVKLTHINSEQKASVRLVSSLYIVLILLYIRFIYNDTNYDGLILYFVTLAVGRFLYFDFTVKSFVQTVRGVVRNAPLLLLMGGYSALICWFGFHEDFLLKSNGVIVSTLIAHLFMDLSVFILHKTKLLRLFLS